jgi:phosphoribosylformylglycinamidine cyclo-ligase
MASDRYKSAGVDLEASDRAKHRISAAVESTQTPLTLSAFGSFGGMVRVPERIEQPALVMSTDGVGTKVLVAIRAGVHDTVGEDLVNHSVNDILVHGAYPLAFLDYIAGSKVDVDTVAALVDGVARGCREHDMALVGGETAQMPDVYVEGHYDLAGTIVGCVSERSVIKGDRIQPGDVLVGYGSNGLHTNGYTLARQIVFEDMGLEIDAELPDTGMVVGEALLAVHRSYWKVLQPALSDVNGLAHITGGGIPGNLNRPLPRGCAARVETSAWTVPPLFRVLQQAGGVDDDEMYRVFNMGVGMIAIVPQASTDDVRGHAESAGVETWVIGEVVHGDGVELV